MNAPLSRFLVEFPREQPPPPVVPVEPCVVDEPLPVEPEPEPLISLSLEALVQKLQEAGEQAAAAERARVQAELTTHFEAERAAMQAGFEAARENWANEQGRQISESLTAAVAELEARLSLALAQALQPLFAEAAQARMMAELGTALAAILGDPSHPPVRIQGPVDLLTAFGTAHAGDIAIDYVVAEDQAELTIVTETTRIETRLSTCLEPFRRHPPAQPAAPP